MQSFKLFLAEKFQLTLKYHNQLNTKLWKKDTLRPGIATKLMTMAWEFAKFSGIPRGKVKDIIITGGNCNYNYTKFSDIDVHLICNLSGMNSDKLYDKKVEWNSKVVDKIGGYPLEFYAADSDIVPANQGVYSIMQDKWLLVPKHLDNVGMLSDPFVIEQVKFNIKYVRQLIRSGSKEDIQKFKEKMWRGRSAGLQREGEFSVENVIYKDLRNRNLIDKLNKKLSTS
jgi:hypothetical protein